MTDDDINHYGKVRIGLSCHFMIELTFVKAAHKRNIFALLEDCQHTVTRTAEDIVDHPYEVPKPPIEVAKHNAFKSGGYLLFGAGVAGDY
jgi:hypothetical protein